jgi:hypothetical protein
MMQSHLIDEPKSGAWNSVFGRHTCSGVGCTRDHRSSPLYPVRSLPLDNGICVRDDEQMLGLECAGYIKSLSPDVT